MPCKICLYLTCALLIVFETLGKSNSDSFHQGNSTMAEETERIATATAAEVGLDKVVVTCLVEGLQVKGVFSKEPKNAAVSVKFAERGFDMSATVKNQGTETKFRKVVRKLPGAIQKSDCEWKAEKGKVILTLKKSTTDSWAVQLATRGLEQQVDEEEENDE